ncbi:hypothetical protein BH20ACT24_BH20ACT24_16020 [soil metagenome]
MYEAIRSRFRRAATSLWEMRSRDRRWVKASTGRSRGGLENEGRA